MAEISFRRSSMSKNPAWPRIALPQTRYGTESHSARNREVLGGVQLSCEDYGCPQRCIMRAEARARGARFATQQQSVRRTFLYLHMMVDLG